MQLTVFNYNLILLSEICFSITSILFIFVFFFLFSSYSIVFPLQFHFVVFFLFLIILLDFSFSLLSSSSNFFLQNCRGTCVKRAVIRYRCLELLRLWVVLTMPRAVIVRCECNRSTVLNYPITTFPCPWVAGLDTLMFNAAYRNSTTVIAEIITAFRFLVLYLRPP